MRKRCLATALFTGLGGLSQVVCSCSLSGIVRGNFGNLSAGDGIHDILVAGGDFSQSGKLAKRRENEKVFSLPEARHAP